MIRLQPWTGLRPRALPVRLASLSALALALTGCASFTPDAGLGAVQQATEARLEGQNGR